jgi:hypothetical protein
MQLRIQRSQRVGGITGGTVFFCLDVRAAYTAEEQANINKYRMGGEIVYASPTAQQHAANVNAHLDTGGWKGLAKGAFSAALAAAALRVSVGSLGSGHHIECKNMEELLDAEDTLRAACKNLTRWLEIADTFNGSELVISYDNGQEEVHVTTQAPPLIEASVVAAQAPQQITYATPIKNGPKNPVEWFNELPDGGKIGVVIVALVMLLLIVASAMGKLPAQQQAQDQTQDQTTQQSQ